MNKYLKFKIGKRGGREEANGRGGGAQKEGGGDKEE